MENIKKILHISLIIFVFSLTSLTIVLTLNENLKNNHIGLQSTRSIQVSAEETIYQEPDEAKIILSVLTYDSDYLVAVKNNNEKMKLVTSYLKDEGIEENDLRTENFRVIPKYRNVERGQMIEREVVGYEVENSLLFNVKDLQKIDQYIAGAIKLGANKVSNLTFLVSNEEDLKFEARDKAVRKAKKEAQKIADSLDVRLGRILNFSESGYFYPVRMSDSVSFLEKESIPDVPISPGENRITSSVNINFEIY